MTHGNSLSKGGVTAVTLFLLLTQLALAQQSAASRDTLRAARQMKMTTTNPTPDDLTETDVTVGVGFDHDESNVRTLTTPFDVGYKFNGDIGWVLDAIGDGYTRARKPAPTHAEEGFASLRLQASHMLVVKGVDLYGQLIAPPTDAPGWTTVSQKLGLRGSKDLPAPGWSMVSVVALRHDDRIAAGTSHFWRSVHAELDCDTKGPLGSLALGATRFTQAGSPGLTEISGEWDLPLDKKFTLISQLTRGLSSGAAHTAVEFDLKWTH